MRVIFMGTSAFAVAALSALASTGGVTIPAVYTQPPRRSGRGHKLQKTDVHQKAERLALEVATPERLSGESEALAGLAPDLILVASYGLLLPQSVLSLPKYGCVNIHASTLPRWRGASPIQQAIMAGDKTTGVDFFLMEKGLDTGPILMRHVEPIYVTDTGGSLHDRLAERAGEMVPRFIAGLEAGEWPAQAQPDLGITKAPKIGKADSIIDWTKPARDIERMIRAFDPWPGAWTHFSGERLRLREASVKPGSAPPGKVVAAPLVVATGDGLLEVRTVQRAGRKPMASDELIRGFAIPPGVKLGG